MSTTTSSRSSGAAKVDWMSQVRKTIKGRPTAAVIYGVPGIGKTSMAASAPSPIFITGPIDVGVETLKSSGQLSENVHNFPPCNSWSEILSQLDWLATNPHDRKTVVIDNIGDAEMLCHAEVTRRDYNGDSGPQGFQNYKNGYDTALVDVRTLLNAADRCREVGMSVILIGHAKTEEFKNPSGANYDHYVPDVHKKTWGVINKWADIVLFCNYFVVVAGQKDDMKKGKARGGDQRLIYCTKGATYEAKNRHNLPDEIPMGESGATAWANLINAIKEGRAA